MEEVTNVVEAILTAILQWRVAWLDEQKNISQPPPICRTQPKKLKITYQNYKDYESTFMPLLMHEIWAQIYEEWNKIQCELSGTPMDIDETSSILANTNIDPKVQSSSRFGNITSTRQIWVGISDYKSEGQFQSILKCQYLIESNKVSDHLKLINEGDLVRLDITVYSESCQTLQTNPCRGFENVRDPNINGFREDNLTKKEVQLSLFAYVADVSSERLTKYSTLAECFQSRPNRNYHVITYHVAIAKRPLRLKMSVSTRMSLLYYLKPMIRQIEAVAVLRESVLASDVLNPKHITCQLSVPTVVSIKSPHYNDMQYKAIIGANEALVRSIPKIQLIQGPPGTGKTHTLIGIIKHFYTHWHDTSRLPKILICAPSNGAIDEVAKRLHKEREFLKKSSVGRSLRMVRVGHPDQINDAVKVISLEELVETNASFKLEGLKRKHMSRIKELERELSQCDTEITNLRYLKRHSEISTVEMKVASLLKELEASKATEDISAKREVSEASKRNIRYELIKNADVILSTLNSCQRYPLDVLFKNERNDLSLHCVIVDEASQCCEPEILMPLCYRISKMILIGDPMQLPATVISRHAHEFDFGRSLFERFFIHFGKYDSTSPIAMLTEQYRMHPEICSFPSKQFYDNRLISSRQISNTYPLKPYMMFDLLHSNESKSNKTSLENEVEASFVRNLLVAVMTKAPESSSIGVITPYKSQKRLITNKIQTLQSQRNISVDVNTCDGFQGQEKDIIILSCVRAFESNSWASVGFLKSIQRINVALTRAKHSLIICISTKSLSNDKTWQALVDDARMRECVETFDKTPSSEALKNVIYNNLPPPASKLIRTKGSIQGNGYEPEYIMPMDID